MKWLISIVLATFFVTAVAALATGLSMAECSVKKYCMAYSISVFLIYLIAYVSCVIRIGMD
jgi:phosphate starvation-inducible membrane PsiE